MHQHGFFNYPSEVNGLDLELGENYSGLLSVAQESFQNAFLNIMLTDTVQVAKPESFCKEVNG